MPSNSSPASFNPETDIPPLDAKVILITGSTHGLGKQSVLEFARHNPREIWLAARNVVQATAVVDEIMQTVSGASIHILELDLASFSSVEKAAKTFLSACDRRDILMLNAGIMAVPPGTTNEGYKVQFGTNHMGHALLTKLLLPTLNKTVNTAPGADVRIFSLSTSRAGGLPLRLTRHYGGGTGLLRTVLSKQAGECTVDETDGGNVSEFQVAAVHPGFVQTHLMYGTAACPATKGVRNQIWASVAPDVQGGEYYEPVGVTSRISEDGKDRNPVQRLWDWTENELSRYLASSVK